MSVSAQDRLRSTSLQMTRLLTPYWTHLREGRSRRSSLNTPVWIRLHTAERPRPAPPGSPPHTTLWDCRSRSRNTSHPSPSRWKQRRLMSQCWLSRDSPSPSCHVTFINTNQRGGLMTTPRSRERTRSHRTIRLFPSPAPLFVPSWIKQTLARRGAQNGWWEQLWHQTKDTKRDAHLFHTVALHLVRLKICWRQLLGGLKLSRDSSFRQFNSSLFVDKIKKLTWLRWSVKFLERRLRRG